MKVMCENVLAFRKHLLNYQGITRASCLQLLLSSQEKSLKCVSKGIEKEREYDKTIVINVNTSGIEVKNI